VTFMAAHTDQPMRWRAQAWPSRWATPLIGLLALLGLWALGGWALKHSANGVAFAGFAPAPALRSLAGMAADGALWRAFLPSMRRIALGLGWAVALGVPCGVLVGRSRFFRQFTHLPFQLLRMVSPLAWMPLAILLFPSWDSAIVFLIATASLWPVLFATANGLGKLDPDWFKLAHNLGAQPWHLLTVVVLPAIAQDILTGIRLALGVAWVVLVPAEYLGVTSGLGYAINDARDTLEYDRLAALIIAIGVAGFALDAVLLSLIRRAQWTRGS
jgi:NitT/TauT family transport system permease protein